MRDNQTYISTNFKYRIGDERKINNDVIDEISITTSEQDTDSGEETVQTLVEYHTIADEINEKIEDNTEQQTIEEELSENQNETNSDEIKSFIGFLQQVSNPNHILHFHSLLLVLLKISRF